MGDEQRLDRIEKMFDGLTSKMDNIVKVLNDDRILIAKLEARNNSIQERLIKLEPHDKVHDSDLDGLKKQTWGILGGLTLLGLIAQAFKLL